MAPGLGHALSPAVATGAAGAYLGLLGLTAGLAAGGRVAAFRSGAEAVLFSNAGLRPLGIALWLQARRVAGSWLRVGGTVVYVVAFVPIHGDVAASARAFVGVVLVLALQIALELPVFLLASGRAEPVVRAVAWSGAALGAVFAFAFLGERVRAPLVATFHADPGRFVDALLRGEPAALAIPAAILLALILVVALRGDDALPELYAASTRTLARYERARGSAATRFALGRDERTLARQRPVRAPGGAFALAWKDWLGFRRARGQLAGWLAGATLCAAAGFVAALVSRRFHDPTPLGALGAVEGLAVLTFASLLASVELARDLGKPLFWLAHASLRERLLVWSLARAWRGGVALGLGPLCVALTFGTPLAGLAALALVMVAYWSLQALGVGLYALFPAPLDVRGPMSLLKLIAVAAYLLPPAVMAALVLWTAGSLWLATATAAVALVLEAWGVVALAALRVAERGATLATTARAT